MCFKDRSFCTESDLCARKDCYRNLTPALKAQARRWWNHDPENAPIAFMNFSGGGCFEPIKPEINDLTTENTNQPTKGDSNG